MTPEQGQKLVAAGATVLVAEPVAQLAHFGGPGVIAGLVAGIAAYMVVDDIQKAKRSSGEDSSPDDSVKREKAFDAALLGKRLLVGKSARGEGEKHTEPLPDERQRKPLPVRLTLSRLLDSGFEPSLEQIFLAYTPDGAPITVRAKDLCHVALAGSTGGGKSSIMRLLMSQLCTSGASVLLLNPHYTRYDIQADPPEDWTPFEPYLVYDPMACREYDVIEFYLNQIAEDLLPKRLKKYAQSQPLGNPYFLIIDEYPAIVAHIKKAPDYLAAILREGRKVGIYLITASQDFLVSTVSPGGGGAIRDCYRTAMYVGGDPTTGKTLLDMPPREIPEAKLGEGTIMLRCKTTKQAVLTRVPYVDNDALYRLLGPSTFDADKTEEDAEEDELVTDVMISQLRQPHERPEPRTEKPPVIRSGSRATESADVRRMRRNERLRSTGVAYEAATMPDAANDLTRDEQAVLQAYRSGLKTGNAIAGETRISSTRVNQALNKLARRNLIDWQPRKA